MSAIAITCNLTKLIHCLAKAAAAVPGMQNWGQLWQILAELVSSIYSLYAAGHPL